MTLPGIALDDLRFQEMVNECRRRVADLCPEWTEMNVSDPGITLIELFAWMTDLLSYRIDRIPEKLHVALLELLDIQLYPPMAATADLRFRLEQPPSAPLQIPAWSTEVATARSRGQEPIVFQTIRDFTVKPLQLDAFLLQRTNEAVDVTVANGSALPAGAEQQAFGRPPLPDDQILIGFTEPLDRLLLRVEFDCEPARGVNVVPSDPPLVWEALTGETGWQPVEKISDSTEGFNEGTGSVELALPDRLRFSTIGPHRCQWVRCRVIDRDSHSDGHGYTEPPLISRASAQPIGFTLPAQHSQRVAGELLGRSDGTPGQIFRLRRAPVLALMEGEELEVLTPGQGPERWTAVDTFAGSKPDDRHFKLNGAAGEVELGPVVRQPDGSFRRYGAIPPSHAELRFTAYRHGGGTIGNVSRETLTQLRQPIPGVRWVTNNLPATGGIDGESLAAARRRTAIELRSRDRAITARDYEELAQVATARVARALCISDSPARVRVIVIPRVDAPARQLTIREITADPEMVGLVQDFLATRCLAGVSVNVSPPQFRVVNAVVSVVPVARVDPPVLQRQIEDRLYTYLNPLVGGLASGAGGGWEFGRSLGRSELHPVVQALPGVKEVTLLRVYETDLATGLEQPSPITTDLSLGRDQTIASGTHHVRIETGTAG